MILQTGIDLVEVERLNQLKQEIRQRFLKRVFTEKELSQAGDSNEHLAGNFAAKEAVSKALGTGIGKVFWRDIEVQHDEQGKPHLFLYGKAAEIAHQQGLDTWSISISHTREHAVAVAVAYGNEGAHENSLGQ
jgi:holo-[acyl-carrier-protein] synthase